MAVGSSRKRVRFGARIAAAIVLASIPASGFCQAENPSDALARNVRTLADHPKDFSALIAAGKAALRLGETQAAAGFFGRAAEVNSNSPLPQAGMGAALVATDDPTGALTYFARAQQLGASVASIGCDRGLAYDLLGKQIAAQTDYRAAMFGPDRDEARRRLALSLAISGNTKLALSTLQPLLQQRDMAAQRARALILALSGDLSGAKLAMEYTMPGASTRMDPFFRRLPSLTSVQKAAAVHLGLFPENGIAVASASEANASAPTEDRLASIDQLLHQQASDAPAPAQQTYAPPAAIRPAPAPARPVQLASVSRKAIERPSPNNDLIQTERVASDPGGRKIWLQLASGATPADLPAQFRQIRSRDPSLFTGISGYVASDNSRVRLVIGPFHTQEDARLFSDALDSARIDSFAWTSQPGQVVRRLPSQ